MKNDNLVYLRKEHKQKVIDNLKEFLSYKRANSIDFGSRLLQSFKIVDFSTDINSDSIMVKFEGYDSNPHSNHYWVSKKELEAFIAGEKQIGISLFTDNFYVEGDHYVFELNMIKNGFKKATIHDAEKFKGLYIKHQNTLYKSYDVQVRVSDGAYIEKVIRIFVFEPVSSEFYINKHTVVQNKVEIKNGITFEDFDVQEEFVRKFDALAALKIERQAVIDELKSWFSLNMVSLLDEDHANAFLRKLNEMQ